MEVPAEVVVSWELPGRAEEAHNCEVKEEDQDKRDSEGRLMGPSGDDTDEEQDKCSDRTSKAEDPPSHEHPEAAASSEAPGEAGDLGFRIYSHAGLSLLQ